MKKLLLMISVLALFTINVTCGGGGSSTNTSGKTSVTISLGETRTASHANGGLLSASSTIPSSIANIRFTISAPDMATIESVISVEGRTTISESFEVPNGPNRHFLVEAMDAFGAVLYQGDEYANLDGTPVTLTINMVSTDEAPPTFGGLVSATAKSTTEIELSWEAATDNITPQEKIQYLIYMSTTSGGQDFSSPNFTTSLGITSFTVTGLNPATTYYFVVRAKDEAGNIDSNTVERSATTLAPPDTTPPTFGGLVSATAISSAEINLTWDPATDDVTPSSNIIYLIYQATTSGGQNFAIPTYTTSSGATSFKVTGLTPATTYYFVVRARDAAGNTDTNTVEKSATTLIPPDTTAPTFEGLVSATASSSTEISLTWSPATDNVTPSSHIVYLIYMSTTPGGQNFAIPTSSVTGVTSTTISGLKQSTTYYFVVRAKDEAGNIDTNTVERSATTLTPPDTTPPTFGGIVSATASSSTEISLTWNAATDNVTSSSNIVYLIYMSTTPGGENFSSPSFTTSPGVSSFTVTGLNPNTTYYFVVRAKDEAGNIDTNTVERSAITQITPIIQFVDLYPYNVQVYESGITFSVNNSGNINADNVWVVVQYGDVLGYFNCDNFFATVPAGGSVSHTTDTTLGTEGDLSTYTIRVDPENTIAESNETNNTVCIESYCSDPPSLEICEF